MPRKTLGESLVSLCTKELEMRMVAKNWALGFLPLLLLILSPGVGTTNPGLVVSITQNGLDYAKQYGIVNLEREISNISLPDFKGYYYVSYIGSTYYNFHSLVNQGTHLRNSYVGLLLWEGMKASISNSSISITGNWEITKFFITFGGTFELKTENIYISVSLSLGTDCSTRPTITITDCSSLIGNVSISISGTFSWLVNIFRGTIESALRRTLEENICEKVKSSADYYIQPYLQTFPVTVKVDEISSLDYSLLESPHINWQKLDMMFKGEFFSTRQRSPVPFDAPPLSLPRESNRMIYFAISDYLFNTASRVYQEAGVMNFSITNDMIPSEAGISLNTSLFSSLIPELTSAYPNMLMEFQVFPALSPLLVFSPGNITLMPEIYVEAFVVSPDSFPKSVFLLSVVSPYLEMKGTFLSKPTIFKMKNQSLNKSDVDLWQNHRIHTWLDLSVFYNLESRRVAWGIEGSNDLLRVISQLVMELKDSAIGQFSVSPIEQTLNFLASLFLFPAANAKLQDGFSLPLTRDIFLYDFILRPYENYLLLGANIHYGPEGEN